MATSPPVHRPAGWQSDADRRAARDRARVNPYSNARWRKLRAAYLATHPICECGCGHVATVVNHRRPHLGDATLLYAWDNLEAMTKPCHDRRTATHDGGFGNPVHRAA